MEQHTRHYVYASDDRSDPNFYTNRADTTRVMIPFFQQFREMGEKDQSSRSISRNGTATHKRIPLRKISSDLSEATTTFCESEIHE
ncbi:Exc2 family lipoprotein (plasmid) [Escherichia coli]